MSAPSFIPLKKTDYGPDGLGSKDALDKFFTQLNSQNDALQQNLSGGISWEQLGGEEWEITVKTPATDWISVSTFTNSWAVWAVAPFGNPQYRRRADGVVELRGLMKSGTIGSAAFTLPVGYRPLNQQLWCTSSNNSFSRLDVQTDGVVVPAIGSNVYFSLDGVSFAEATNTPGAYSCFPVNVRCKDGAKPRAVFLTAVIDQNQTTPPTPVSPSAVAWTPNQAKSGFPNSFSLNNIAGLQLGRTYTVRGVVLYA